MSINVAANFTQVQEALLWQGKQARYALSQAINDTAFKARAGTQAEMRKSFDRPSDYTLRSVRVVKLATKDALTATIQPNQSGAGVDPQKFLQPEVFGGPRRLKRSEIALRRVGVLPDGMFTAMPNSPVSEQVDQFGNYKGAFMRMLAAYFAGATAKGDKRKSRLAKTGRNDAGQRTIGGVIYFAVTTRESGGLPLGIWAKTGVHGRTVRPVLMFVRPPMYRARLDLDRVGQDTINQHFESAFATRFAAAMASAQP